jgi:hypothetical protein
VAGIRSPRRPGATGRGTRLAAKGRPEPWSAQATSHDIWRHGDRWRQMSSIVVTSCGLHESAAATRKADRRHKTGLTTSRPPRGARADEARRPPLRCTLSSRGGDIRVQGRVNQARTSRGRACGATDVTRTRRRPRRRTRTRAGIATRARREARGARRDRSAPRRTHVRAARCRTAVADGAYAAAHAPDRRVRGPIQ